MWKSERIIFKGEEFKSTVQDLINNAKHEILLETYILGKDNFAQSIVDTLANKSATGVKVKLLVDGFGSWPWIIKLNHAALKKIELRTYHPLPWPFSKFDWISLLRFVDLVYIWKYTNKRDHKKLLIVDKQLALVGSRNICEESIKWQETSILLEGPGIEGFRNLFLSTWSKSSPQDSKTKAAAPEVTDHLLHNETRKANRERIKIVTNLLNRATRRIWITTPYFFPPQKFLRILKERVAVGVDVTLVLPQKSDVPFSQWMARSLYFNLLKYGIKVYEYKPHVLHAKSLLVDNTLIIGSSNFNNRSFFRDLELDVVLDSEKSKTQFENKFLADLNNSIKVIPKKVKFSWLGKSLAYVLTIFRSSF